MKCVYIYIPTHIYAKNVALSQLRKELESTPRKAWETLAFWVSLSVRWEKQRGFLLSTPLCLPSCPGEWILFHEGKILPFLFSKLEMACCPRRGESRPKAPFQPASRDLLSHFQPAPKASRFLASLPLPSGCLLDRGKQWVRSQTKVGWLFPSGRSQEVAKGDWQESTVCCRGPGTWRTDHAAAHNSDQISLSFL